MAKQIKIDFVSDVSCPWCVIGLKSLEDALGRVQADITAELHFQPFELNPQMSREGEDIEEHLIKKIGTTSEQLARSREAIRSRGAEFGFEFNMERRGRIYNTFDAHRLLHWAEDSGKQKALKEALFSAYFTDGRDPSDPQTLVELAGKVGLDQERARKILASDEYAAEVREREQMYRQAGINAVPAIILNDRYLVQGGQPPEIFEKALRQAANG